MKPDNFNTVREKLLAVTKQQIAESFSHDTTIMQQLATIDDITIQVNALSKRLREWHGAVIPEVSFALSDHEVFVTKIATESYA